GSATIPRYKSVSEQLASCVPYIEVTSEDGKITAVNYKLVNPQDTSTALQPSYRTDFRISIMHSDDSSILRSSWYNNTNQGTWTLDEPEALSNVSFILVRVQYHESGNEFLDYQWDFAPVSAPAPIEITTTSLPNGTKETPYTVTLAANVSGATWSVSSGTLPAGLTLDPSTGEISGIPTSSGAFTFTLTASNSAGSDSRTFMLTIESVAGAPMITTPQDLGTFQHLQDVSVQLEATGATPITWTAMGLPSWLTFDAESATISGTAPDKSGETSFTVVAANAAGKDSRKFTLKVKSSTSEITAPSITTASLDDGKAGELYNVTLDATGTSPLTWTATGLPDGLTLNTSGKLTGVPKVSGTFTVVVTAENSVGNDTKEYSLTIADSDKVTPPKITTETLDEATAGEAYSFQFKAEGKSITWTATWKTLTGLTFSPGGLLTGTPKTAGTYNITVKAKNTAGTDYANLTLKVNSTGSNVNAPVVKSSKIPDAYQGEDYSYFLEAEGTGLTWKLADGESLPGGLELTEEGEVTGRVETSKATTFKFNVIASNSAGSSKAKQISLKVVANAPEFKSDALKEAKWNKKYSYTLKVKNMKPTVWSIEGDLPEGVKFDKGKFSGKPTEAGEFELTISASNGAVEISDEFTLNVKGVTPKIKGSFKKGTEGEAYRSVLKATGVTPLTWDFEDLPDGLDFTTNATGEECTIFGTPEKLFSGKIQVTVENGSGDDQSYSKGMKMTIKAVKPKFSTTISDIPDGVVGEMYSCQLKLSTNNAEVIWSYSGEMPEGLTMDEDTGLIYGVPMKAGENFKIKVTAANANKLSYKSTQTFYISIKEAPASDKPEEPEAPEFENGVAFHERDALAAETLAVIANNDEVIAAVLPALEVEEAGLYEFAVSLDVNVPEGGLLVWHSFPDGEDDEGDNDNAVFLDEDGEAIERVPETYSVTVSAWLEPGIIYEPIIAVKIRE
ncbi:MAG: putative Ig domain-containing protein, partial [Synergistaceae bacterium]|nr:putative Ig domain-containing protein [Synergistaceae bacterium]